MNKNFKKISLFALLLLAFLLSFFLRPASESEAAPSPKPRNGIVSFVPSGKVADNVAFKIIFSEAMVSKDAIGKSLSVNDFPFEVSPSIQAEGKWLDNKTFTASLLAPLDMGTAYQAKIRDNLISLKGKNIGSGQTFSFQTSPLSLLSLRSLGIRSEQAEFELEFNAPVLPSRLRGFLSIALGNEGGAPSYYAFDSTYASKKVRVSTRVGAIQSPLTASIKIAAGLTGERGSLGLEKDEIRALEFKPSLTVERIEGRENGIGVYTNFAADTDALKDFIEIEPKIPFQIEPYYSGLFYIKGNFEPRQRFVVTLKKGLSARDNGLVLEDNYTASVIMPDLSPSINFSGSGMFLSPVWGGKVPLELVNINKVQLSVWRLYENNIPVMMRGDYPYFQRDLARRVYNKEFSLTPVLNERIRRAIPLDEMLSGDRGLFQISITNPDYEYWYEQNQIVNLSDMGIVARLWEDGALFWVNTLSDLKPVQDAHVRLYSAANQILGEGKTDADGVFHLHHQEPWSTEESMVPALATVSKGNDVSFVRLTRGLFSQEIFDTSGRPWLKSGYDAVIFSPRDIYRTGEQVTFKAVVRTYDLKIPEPFPLLFVVRDPLGRTIRRGTALLEAEGSTLFTLDLPGNALTGLWQVNLYIPGDENRSLAQMTFNVEDFAPPRIEVKLNVEPQRLTPGDVLNYNITGRYLFGVTASGLRWETVWGAREGSFKPGQEKWKGFNFKDPRRTFAADSGVLEEGVLDGEGMVASRADWPLTVDNPPSVIDFTLVGRVMEEGGRWVSDSVVLQYFSTPWLLGLRNAEGIFGVGSDIIFQVAAVTPDESPADPGELTATFYRVTWNYNLVEIDGYMRWQSSEELEKVKDITFTLTDGIGQVSFKPERWGTYMLSIADAHDNATNSTRFYVDDPEYADKGGSQLLDRVEIELDKPVYKVGDTAKVTLRAPFEGLMLFNVEAESVIDRKILKIQGSETVIEVPVTEKMLPNAWCSAWLIRPLTSADEGAWSTHRALGLARLKVDLEKFTLSVDLVAPEKIEPASKLSVKVNLKDSTGKPTKGELAIALVDDGVLGLTKYQTPNLLEYFWGQRQLNSNGYDIYDLLMPLESKATALLHPAGDSAADAFMGGGKAQRFKILSLFEGLVPVDDSGTVELNLDLPEFSGRGRLFVVATSGNRFGSAEQKVQIARDIVTEADLPRFAAPGDTFTVPVTVFNSAEVSRDVTVELSALGELELGETTFKGLISPKGSLKWDVGLTAKNSGTATYVVKTLWQEEGQNKSFEQRIDLPIRSPFPVVTLLGSGFFKSGDSTILISKDFFEGSASGKLTLADTPLVDLTQATSFLANYPYGCLEQTLSSTWPFLVLPDALAQIDPLLVDKDSVRMKTDKGLSRLQSMQLYDGSFVRWPGDSFPYNWGSVYAAHFLVEARKVGVSYPEEMLRNSLTWLRQFLASIPSGRYPTEIKDDLTSKAYAAYVLALNGEKPLGWLYYLEENKKEMWPSGRIWLAGARALIDGKAEALRELGTLGGNSTIPPEALYETLESDVRNVAQLLSLWSEVEPQSTEALELAKTLLEWGRANKWFSTQENATVAMALGRYLTKTGYEKSALEAVLKNDAGEKLLEFRSGAKSFIRIEDLSDGNLSISAKGIGSGYFSWNFTGTPVAAPRPESKGLSVSYRWSDREGQTIALDKTFEQGEEIVVTLSLNPSVTVSNLVVSYLLPAGMEIENPRFKENTEYSEDQQPGVRFDVRDDRLLLFIDRLSGITDYRFLMRAVTRGSFKVPPVAAEGMYDPNIRFIGPAGKNITIK